jgi:hypothetical protein
MSRNPPWIHHRQRAIRDAVEADFFLTEDPIFPSADP